jgi:hypothetical protein
MKKIFVIGVIFLFMGVAFAPSINVNVVKASNDNELVEVTTQACGIKGFGNTTVKLTRQQYQELEQYLVEFRTRLNQTTIREEAIPIFKEAVVELDKYGLLPKGMSLEQAQKLVIGKYQHTHFMRLPEKIYNEDLPIINSNFFCLIAGRATNTTVVGPMLLVTYYLAFLIENHKLLIPLFLLCCLLLPFEIAGIISMGSVGVSEDGERYSPCRGWTCTIGLLGIKSYFKSFYGNMYSVFYSEFGGPLIGAIGFTGFRIPMINLRTGEISSFYLGHALYTKISSSPWDQDN